MDFVSVFRWNLLRWAQQKELRLAGSRYVSCSSPWVGAHRVASSIYIPVLPRKDVLSRNATLVAELLTSSNVTTFCFSAACNGQVVMKLLVAGSQPRISTPLAFLHTHTKK
jgi:hypothetical protein